MCYGRCIKYVGYKLLILAVLCIVANILLYFPNGEIGYASHNHLSRYVGCLHGIVGGGILVSNKSLYVSFLTMDVLMLLFPQLLNFMFQKNFHMASLDLESLPYFYFLCLLL